MPPRHYAPSAILAGVLEESTGTGVTSGITSSITCGYESRGTIVPRRRVFALNPPEEYMRNADLRRRLRGVSVRFLKYKRFLQNSKKRDFPLPCSIQRSLQRVILLPLDGYCNTYWIYHLPISPTATMLQTLDLVVWLFPGIFPSLG